MITVKPKSLPSQFSGTKLNFCTRSIFVIELIDKNILYRFAKLAFHGSIISSERFLGFPDHDLFATPLDVNIDRCLFVLFIHNARNEYDETKKNTTFLLILVDSENRFPVTSMLHEK